MIFNLEEGSPVGMILAKTFNVLDTVHKGETTFFARSPFVLQV